MPSDLWTELQQKAKELDYSIKQLRQTGTAYAEAEREYKVKLREVCLRLRSDAMPIGLIDKTCYGEPEVAALRFKRDVCEAVWKANQEAVNSIKLQMRLIDSQIQREWGHDGQA